MRKVLSGALVFGAIILLGLMTWEPLLSVAVSPPPLHDYDGRIVRDEFGVPHLFGKTDADVVYALAYAHAEDDFSTLQDVIAMTRGRAGAITGTEGAKIDYALHLLDVRTTVVSQYDRVPADVRVLLDAYATGLNKYARRHPEDVKLAKLFPVNGQDIAAGFVLRSPFFFGLDQTLGALVESGMLPTESAAPMLPGDMDGSNVICPHLSGPKSLLFWIMKEIGNAVQEAQAGGDYRQAA